MRFEAFTLKVALLSFLSTCTVSAKSKDREVTFDADNVFNFLLSNKDAEYGSSMTRPPTPRPTCKPGEYGCGSTRHPTPRPTCKPGEYGCATPPPTPRPICLVDVSSLLKHIIVRFTLLCQVS